MKIKYNSHLHQDPLWTDDFYKMPELPENSPVHYSTPHMPAVAESGCRDPNMPDSTPNMPSVAEYRQASLDKHLDDSGIDVTGDTAEPCLDDLSEEIQLYIQKLKNDKLDLAITNRRINEQIIFQLRFSGDLQMRYEDSLDMTVSLRERIHELESREERYIQSFNPESEAVLRCFEQLKSKNEECCRLKADLTYTADEMKLWRVRAKMLDIDNDFYKREIADLRENMIELSRENLIEKDKSCKDTESNNLAEDMGSKPKADLMEPSLQPGPESETPMAKVATATENSRDVSKRNEDMGSKPKADLMEPSLQPGPESETPMAKVATATENSRDVSKRNDSGIAVAEKTQMTCTGSRAPLVKLPLKENAGSELPLVQQTRKGDREAKPKVPRLNRKQLKPASLPTSDCDGYNEEIPRPKAPFLAKYSNVDSMPALNNNTFMPLPPLAKRIVFPQLDRPGVKSTQSTPLISAVLEGNSVHLPRIMRPGTPLDRANPAKLGPISLPKLVNPLKHPGQPSNEKTKGLNKFTPLPPTAPRGRRSRPYSGKSRNLSQAGGQKKSGAD